MLMFFKSNQTFISFRGWLGSLFSSSMFWDQYFIVFILLKSSWEVKVYISMQSILIWFPWTILSFSCTPSFPPCIYSEPLAPLARLFPSVSPCCDFTDVLWQVSVDIWVFPKVPLLIALLRKCRGCSPLPQKGSFSPSPLVDSKEIPFAGKLRKDLAHGSPREKKGQISLLTKISNLGQNS